MAQFWNIMYHLLQIPNPTHRTFLCLTKYFCMLCLVTHFDTGQKKTKKNNRNEQAESVQTSGRPMGLFSVWVSSDYHTLDPDNMEVSLSQHEFSDGEFGDLVSNTDIFLIATPVTSFFQGPRWVWLQRKVVYTYSLSIKMTKHRNWSEFSCKQEHKRWKWPKAKL